ncbi:MAG: hypothetical protein ACOC8Y_00865 [Candidatus Natronoplasma sp.]
MRNNNQIFGYVVLVMGLILLLITFSLAIIFIVGDTAYWLSRFSILETSGGGIDNLVTVMQTHFFPLILLLVMGSTGGRIAKFGIDLVRSPENGKDEFLIAKGSK